MHRAALCSRVATCLSWFLYLVTTPSSAQSGIDSVDRLQIAATPSGLLSTGGPGTRLHPPPQPEPARSDWEEHEGVPPAPPPNGDAQPAPKASARQPIQHSVELPPIDSRLAPGRVFDPSLLQVQPVEADWYRIPQWLAGLWQKKSETILQKTDFLSGEVITRASVSKRRQSMVFGTQLDRAGNVWHLVKLPIIRKFRMENRIEYKVEVALAFPTQPFDQAFSAARTIVVQVENDTNLIVQTRQEEGIWHMSPISDRDVRCLGSMKSFVMNGTAIGIYRVALKLHRAKPFEIQPTAGNQVLRASLAEYLASHGMAGLAPSP